MDLDGYLYDYGLREVRPASASERPAVAASGVEESGAAAWLIAGAGLAITLGLALAARRRRG